MGAVDYFLKIDGIDGESQDSKHANEIEVITGVNMPMVITALTKREGKNIKELAQILKEQGSHNINIASEILSTTIGKK